jgi:hypothetical protein
MTNSRARVYLTQLEELAKKASIKPRFEKFDGKGGFCRVKDKHFIIINKHLPLDTQVEIFRSELEKLGISLK